MTLVRLRYTVAVALLLFSGCSIAESVSFRSTVTTASSMSWQNPSYADYESLVAGTPATSDVSAVGNTQTFGPYQLEASDGLSAHLVAAVCFDATCTATGKMAILARDYEAGGVGWADEGDEFGRIDGVAGGAVFQDLFVSATSNDGLMTLFTDGALGTVFQKAVYSAANAWDAAEDVSVTTALDKRASSAYGSALSVATGADDVSYLGFVSSSGGGNRFRVIADGDAVSTSLIFPGEASQVKLLKDGLGVTALWQATRKDMAAAGNGHSCYLSLTGRLECLGANDMGQVGDGNYSTSVTNATVVVGLDSKVLSVAAGSDFTCALMENGKVKCFGANDVYQAGLIPAVCYGAVKCVLEPEYVQLDGDEAGDDAEYVELSGAIGVAAGTDHACALLVDGTVKCWGDNTNNQLGGTCESAGTKCRAVTVAGISQAVQIAAGGSTTCAITTAGALKCWGLNGSGQIGDGTTTNRSTATQVTGFTSGVTAVSVGAEYVCAIQSAAGYCWGKNDVGQLGHADLVTPVLAPQRIMGDFGATGMSLVAAGSTHACAKRTSNGALYCWGSGTSTPAVVAGISSHESLALGVDTTFAVTTIGLYAFGENGHSELGDGTTIDRATPFLTRLWTRAVSSPSYTTIASSYWTDDSWPELGTQKFGWLSATEARSFAAAADENGNVLLAFNGYNTANASCLATTTPDTTGCAYRVYGAVRNALGIWNGPSRLDGDLSENVTTIMQSSDYGIEYVTPEVAYLGDGQFIVVFPVIDNSARTSSLYVRRYVVGVGWLELEQLDSDDLLSPEDEDPIPSEQYRTVIEQKLVTDGNGNALLLVYGVVYSDDEDELAEEYTVDNRHYGYWVYRYDGATGQLGERERLTGIPLCPASEAMCISPKKPQAALFSTGEALIVAPGPDDEDNPTMLRLYSVEYR